MEVILKKRVYRLALKEFAPRVLKDREPKRPRGYLARRPKKRPY